MCPTTKRASECFDLGEPDLDNCKVLREVPLVDSKLSLFEDGSEYEGPTDRRRCQRCMKSHRRAVARAGESLITCGLTLILPPPLRLRAELVHV